MTVLKGSMTAFGVADNETSPYGRSDTENEFGMTGYELGMTGYELDMTGFEFGTTHRTVTLKHRWTVALNLFQGLTTSMQMLKRARHDRIRVRHNPPNCHPETSMDCHPETSMDCRPEFVSGSHHVNADAETSSA